MPKTSEAPRERVGHRASWIRLLPAKPAIGEQITLEGLNFRGSKATVWLLPNDGKYYPEKVGPRPPYDGIILGITPIDESGSFSFKFLPENMMGPDVKNKILPVSVGRTHFVYVEHGEHGGYWTAATFVLEPASK